jgi:hypothetical protein
VSTVYRVVRRDGTWCVLLPDSLAAIYSSDNRAVLVQQICAVAQAHDAVVCVEDHVGHVELTYTYVNGVEDRKYTRATR